MAKPLVVCKVIWLKLFAFVYRSLFLYSIKTNLVSFFLIVNVFFSTLYIDWKLKVETHCFSNARILGEKQVEFKNMYGFA